MGKLSDRITALESSIARMQAASLDRSLGKLVDLRLAARTLVDEHKSHEHKSLRPFVAANMLDRALAILEELVKL